MDDATVATTPLTCPSTVTIRRNPHRRARPTPTTTTTTATTTNPLPTISTFPLNDILSMDPLPPPQPTPIPQPPDRDTLRVFLRVRPLAVSPPLSKKPRVVPKKVVKKCNSDNNKKSCLVVSGGNSVTVSPPGCDSGRLKSEVYNGFSRVFTQESSQEEVYDKLMRPIVDEYLQGISGLLAALGPSGSGKTHTVFGTGKEPGLVPRALRRIFELDAGNKARSFYLSVFEIYAEKGKGEKLSDLAPDAGDIYMQQSVIKGLKEVLVRDVAQAESVLAHAQSKRATAMTNSNSQSSRSQCIINIRSAVDEADEQRESQLGGAVLTFVDLAGAEREKKTGNQGGRLLESNFINNTSMVFGLCLRSLLEHQKNPKKPLQKHFQSSLLTRFLRDYLEGRKRMTLILTVRSGAEDYFDTSFLLRQASPFMEIKFHNIEENSNLPNNKRLNQSTCIEQRKRVKLCDPGDKDEVARSVRESNFHNEDASNGYKSDHVPGVSENTLTKPNSDDGKLQREYCVIQGFAKALWNVLKQYKERVKAMQNDIDVLTKNLTTEHDQYLLVERELHNLKSQCSCRKPVPVVDTATGGANEPRIDVLKEVIDHGLVVPTEVQGLTTPKCSVNGKVSPVREQCLSHTQHAFVGITIPEEQHESYPSRYTTANSFLEEDVHGHCDSEVNEASTSEVGCQRNEFEIILPGQPGLEEGNGFTGSRPVPSGFKEIQDPGPTDISEVHLGDSPSSRKISMFVDEEIAPDVILRTPFPKATLLSLDAENSMQESNQASVMDHEISHDHVSRNGCYEKDTRKKDGAESTEPVACLPRSHVKCVKLQGESSSHIKDVGDKENVAKCPGHNSNSERQTKESSHCTPLRAERPKRRLMPASSVLLRDVGSLDATHEDVKLRGGRGGQRLVEEECKRTRGSASLLRLLKNHLPR